MSHSIVKKPSRISPRLCVCAVAAFLLSALSAHAQGYSTMYKTMDVSAFGGYTYVNPGLQSAPSDNGGTIGLDVTRYFNFPLTVSLEGRASIANGSVENEKSYGGGVKLGTGPFLHRIRPYGDFFGGFGTIHYDCFNSQSVATPTCGIRGDNSSIWIVGGGADVHLTGNFSAKADFQYQYWDLGHHVDFNPTLLTIGLQYRIPFAPHTREHVHN